MVSVSSNLRDLPKKIYTAQEKLNDLTTEISELRDKIESMELNFVSSVVSEVDASSKPKYTNETSRKTEINARQQASVAYQNILRQMRSLEREKAQQMSSISLLQNEFRASLSLSALYSSWISSPGDV